MTTTRILRSVFTFAFIAIARTSAAQAAVQIPARDTTISISVTRGGRVMADRMTFYIGVEGIAENAGSALERLGTRLKVVQDTLRRVSPTTLVDAPLIIGVVSGNPSSYPPQPNSATVARGALRVTVAKASDIAPLQSAALAAGVSVIGNMNYDATQVEATWKTKIAEATAAAHDVAEIAAAAQGKKLGALLSMNVSGGPQAPVYQQPLQLNFDARGYSNSPLGSPEVMVNATVSVVYLLVKK